MADPLDLARRGRIDELNRQALALRGAAGFSAATALEFACAWLLAGDPRQADLAFLEADQLDPSLALVPDVWGLWPAPPATNDPAAGAERQLALALAERFRSWRHPDAQALWRELLPRLQVNWQLALEPQGADPLLLLGRASAAADAPPLDPPLEPELARLVSDEQILAEPAASSRFWQLVATIRPQWDLARVRAADLALARGELEASSRWLADPPPAALANPWFHDVSARLALQGGAVDQALEAWAAAIRAAQATPDTTAFAEIFEQRRRQARRGPGVLQVRHLAQQGEQHAARALLHRLLAEDPQWQPLRNLQAQLRPAEPQPVAAAPDATSAAGVTGSGGGEAFSALLDRATARLQALGVPIPPPATDGEPDADAMAELEALSLRLSDYEARFALA
jgi:hypothetical protein